MKIYQFVIGCGILMSVAACNSDTSDVEGISEGHTCGRSCSSTSCDRSHSHDIVGDFDFAMHSVCQASCGVSEYDEDDIVEITEAEVGDITMCPVSGAIYQVKESSPILEHDGETFHSCCDGCAKKFKEEPDRFYKNV